MIKDEGCVKFLGLSGALVPAGMRRCVVEMIRNGQQKSVSKFYLERQAFMHLVIERPEENR
jgi:hypothetical protein